MAGGGDERERKRETRHRKESKNSGSNNWGIWIERETNDIGTEKTIQKKNNIAKC